MIETFDLHHASGDEFVEFLSEKSGIKLRVPTHVHLFTTRSVHLLNKLTEDIEAYSDEMYD
jgi:hypothetical protein